MDQSDTVERLFIPSARVFEIIEQAGEVFLRECPCRAHSQKCPPDTWEVCFLFQNSPQEDLQYDRRVRREEGLAILKTIAARNMIYQLFYKHTGRQLTELCSCCTCCCTPLHRMKQEGNYRDQLRSEYMAFTNLERCIDCGQCQEGRFFEARWLENGILNFAEDRCFGCGRCVTFCPQDAIQLAQQVGPGKAVPTIYQGHKQGE